MVTRRRIPSLFFSVHPSCSFAVINLSVSKNNTPASELELKRQSNLTKQDSKNDDDDFDLTEIDKLIEEQNTKIQVTE